MSRLGTYLRRKLGIYSEPPPEAHNPSKADDLREASASKNASAEALSCTDSELARRRQAESRMLEQLADELEITDSGEHSNS